MKIELEIPDRTKAINITYIVDNLDTGNIEIRNDILDSKDIEKTRSDE